MRWNPEEVMETYEMIGLSGLDVRTVTLGVSLLGCTDPDPRACQRKVRQRLETVAADLGRAADHVERRYGVPIVNRRLAVTPASILMEPWATRGDATDHALALAHALDDAAEAVGVDFIGGYTALAESGLTPGARLLLDATPAALAATTRLCGSVNAATTRAGVNMDAVARLGPLLRATASATPSGSGCARFVAFANAPPDNPFMAGGFHGVAERDATLNVAISGPGVVREVVKRHPDDDFRELAEAVKRAAFKITRVGELVGREMARELDIPFGIVDLSLAPTPREGDSVAGILEAMGVERAGAPGSTLALALLTDAVKKGGLMATSAVGGLSGAFIPVSEDVGMARAAREGAVSLAKLEAMSSVCSVGLDMVCLPGDTPADTLGAIIADELAIGVVNDKTTAARLIPVPDAAPGDEVEFGGLLGRGVVMDPGSWSSARLMARGGRVPRWATSVRN